MKRSLSLVLAGTLALLFVASVVGSQTDPPAGGPPPPPPARAIPGLTAPDPHPRGCVDCHVNMKQFNMDVRISTLMAQWQKGVEPRLLAIAKASANDSTRIKGKHPKVVSTRADFPGACTGCHSKTAVAAPPFARMIHLIHLSGDSSVFLGQYQGDCTHCHKLDMKTGKWSVPSAREPAGS